MRWLTPEEILEEADRETRALGVREALRRMQERDEQIERAKRRFRNIFVAAIVAGLVLLTMWIAAQ